jgi:hypothetical protein
MFWRYDDDMMIMRAHSTSARSIDLDDGMGQRSTYYAGKKVGQAFLPDVPRKSGKKA